MINEDPNLTAIPEEQTVASVDQGDATAVAENFVSPAHPHAQVPEELKGTIEAIKIPDLSLAETVPGVQQHPPKHATITGDLISLPDGFGTREDALAASKGKANDGKADSGRVFMRQDLRGRVRVQEELKRAA